MSKNTQNNGPEIKIRNMEIRDLKMPKSIKEIADLIYEADLYVYPDLFGTKGNARKILRRWLLEIDGVYNLDNITIAFLDNHIIGLAVSVNLSEDCPFDLAPVSDFWVPKRYERVQREYFDVHNDRNEKEGEFIISVSVDKQYRDIHVGTSLIKCIELEKNTLMYIQVPEVNRRMLKVCDNLNFRRTGESTAYGGVETLIDMVHDPSDSG